MGRWQWAGWTGAPAGRVESGVEWRESGSWQWVGGHLGQGHNVGAGVSWAGVDGGNDCYDGNEMDGAGGGWGVLGVLCGVVLARCAGRGPVGGQWAGWAVGELGWCWGP